jgi:hypothetical protein
VNTMRCRINASCRRADGKLQCGQAYSAAFCSGPAVSWQGTGAKGTGDGPSQCKTADRPLLVRQGGKRCRCDLPVGQILQVKDELGFEEECDAGFDAVTVDRKDTVGEKDGECSDLAMIPKWMMEVEQWRRRR